MIAVGKGSVEVTFTSLIDGCAKRSKPKQAAEWLRTMVAEVSGSYCKEAALFCLETFSDSWTPKCSRLCDISLVFCNHKSSEIVLLSNFQSQVEELSPSVECYTAVIDSQSHGIFSFLEMGSSTGDTVAHVLLWCRQVHGKKWRSEVVQVEETLIRLPLA